MAEVEIRFLGSGDAFGSGGRFNTCILLSEGDERALVDCGASSLVAMNRFGVAPNSIDTILLTHLHGDHFGGIPFFLLDGQFGSRRRAPITIAGPPGVEKRVHEAMEALFPGSSTVQRAFEVRFSEWQPQQVARLNGIEVTPYPVDHPSGAPPFALRMVRGGRTVTFTGDTAWCDNLIPAARGADLLIAECCFYDKPVKHHLDFVTLKAKREALGAARVVLTHMGPEMLARVEGLGFEYAEDGKTFRV